MAYKNGFGTIILLTKALK